MTNHPEVLQRAIARMVLKFPFYAAITLMTKLEQDNSIPTAGTDCYTKIIYNREFIESMSADQVMFVLAHEVEHIVRLHADRRASRDMRLWNIAGDHVINTDLLEMGLKGPTDEAGRFMGMADKQFHNVAEEKVYRLIQQEQQSEQKQKPQTGGEGEGEGEGEGKSTAPSTPDGARDVFAEDMRQPTNGDGKPLSEAERSQASREVRGKITQAVAQVKATKGIGSIPAHLRGMLLELAEPRLDWKDVLRDFIRAKCASDYSWSKLNRRVRHRGLRLPSMYSEQIGGIGIIIDTSGSCWQEITKFLSELSAIASEAKPEKMVVLFVDTQVQTVIETTWDNFESDMGDLLREPPHGGGTDLRAGFTWLDESGTDLECVVCLTDMYSPWPDTFCLADETLFVDTEDYGNEPFGRRVVLMGD